MALVQHCSALLIIALLRTCFGGTVILPEAENWARGVLRPSACTHVSTVQHDIMRLLAKERHLLGDSDSNVVLPLLTPSFRRYMRTKPTQWILDVGANMGETSDLMLMLFSRLPCVKYNILLQRPWRNVCSQFSSVRVVGVEAVPATFALLDSRAEKDNWYNANYLGVPYAISNESRSSVPIYSTPGVSADLQASLNRDVATWDFTADGGLIPPKVIDVDYVKQFTIDDLARGIFKTSSIFLLKSDVEGLDSAVLHGATDMLTRRAITWLLFEYSSKWEATYPNDPKYTLRGVTSWLYSLGYTCYLVTPSHFIPLYGKYWLDGDVLELKSWSNVFCGVDAGETAAIVQFYNTVPGGIAGLHLPPC
jgi:FkbM family methyltransferase